MKRIIVLLVCTIYLLGCHSSMYAPEIAAIVSGEIDVIDRQSTGNGNVREDKALKSWHLSKGQLDKLSDWLKLHQSEWTIDVITPPLPSYSARLSHSDGSHSQIDLPDQHVARIRVEDKNGKYVFIGVLSLSSEDIASLKKLLSEER